MKDWETLTKHEKRVANRKRKHKKTRIKKTAFMEMTLTCSVCGDVKCSGHSPETYFYVHTYGNYAYKNYVNYLDTHRI